MGWMEELARKMRRNSTRLADLAAVVSGDPGRMFRRIVNKAIWRGFRKLEEPFYLKPPRKKRRK